MASSFLKCIFGILPDKFDFILYYGVSMRAIWTGSISFGLVNIPVKLYSGSEHNEGLDLRMLHKTDKSPIRYAKMCKHENKEVAFNEIVKGYEYADGDFIILTEEDFEKASPRKTKTINISEFVDEDEIDVRYYEKPYYLEPQKSADKPYALLRDALKKSGRVAIARYVMRNRENLAVIKTVGNALVLNQIRFPNEIREPSQLKLPDTEVKGKELQMALALIEQLSGPFIAEDYHDTYTEELKATIEEKAKGKRITKKTGEPQPTKVNDLMSALRASLEKERTKTGS